MVKSSEKIAFIKSGNFSHINQMVLGRLTAEFPDAKIETIDIYEDLVSDKNFATFFHSFREYKADILNYKEGIIRKRTLTDYFFKNLRKSLVERLADRDYIFTFQTQSLFDASVEGTPHFLYTDHTALANLSYPGFKPRSLPCDAWLECEKDIYHHATLNFTMSTNISNSIIKDYNCDSSKVVCVHSGSNITVAEDEIFDDRRYAEMNILFVGVEWERKGGPTLVEAFKIVSARFPQATLTIVGCSPKLSIPNCNVVGRVPLAKVSEYFKKATVFSLPTRLEPFGIVFLEAMAHKLPIVATRIGAIPEFVVEDKNGYTVEPDNPQQLAEKLIDLISSPEKCKAFGAYAHQLLWDTYTWDKTGIKLRENIEPFINN